MQKVMDIAELDAFITLQDEGLVDKMATYIPELDMDIESPILSPEQLVALHGSYAYIDWKSLQKGE